MKPRLLLLISFLACLTGKLFSQLPGGTLFDSSILHEIRIEFDEDNFWDILLDNYNSHQKKIELPTPRPHFKTLSKEEKLKWMELLSSVDDIPSLNGKVSIDGTEIDPVGVRLKGYSSFFSAPEFKKSLKIDFNEYNDTNNYFGTKKINLNNGVGDPSFQRDVICYYLLRKAGIAVPRTSFAKVYLNDIYWGLYIIVEQIDKTFLKHNFADGNGNLYKNMGWSSLEYISNNFEDYTESIELKTNTDSADGSDYVNLVKSINSLSGSRFNDSIQRLFYVDYFLKVLVIDIITKNWDSFMQNGRNFYLYHEPVSDLFYWIPWDYNLSFDGQFNWSWGNTAECNAQFSFSYDTAGTTMKYLIETSVGQFNYLWMTFGDYTPDTIFYRENMDIGDSTTMLYIKGSHQYAQRGIYPLYFSRGDLNNCWYEYDANAIIMDTAGICHSALYMDVPYIMGDTVYNEVYSSDDFCCSCQWDKICSALKEKLDMQSHIDDSAYPIEYSSYKPLITELMANDIFKDRYLDIFNYILDSVYNENEIIEKIIANTDLIRDAVYADTNLVFPVADFENDINALCNDQNLVTNLTRQISKRKAGLEEEFSSLGYSAQPLERQVNYNDVVINEFAAALRDNEGENLPDWVELYNNTGSIIPLNHFWLSDSIPWPEKFNFPANSAIKPEGFVTVWADKKDSKKGLHANFKLSADGEEIILYNDHYGTIDSLIFGNQSLMATFGRYPDGTGSFILMTPTWNSPNTTLLDIVEPGGGDEFAQDVKLYPNPANKVLTIALVNANSGFRVTLYNLQGEAVLNESTVRPTVQLEVWSLAKGLYVLQIENGVKYYITKVIIN